MIRNKVICLIFVFFCTTFSSAQVAKIDPNASNEVVKTAYSSSHDIKSKVGSYMSSVFSKSVEKIKEGTKAISDVTTELSATISSKVPDIPLEGLQNTFSTAYQDIVRKIDPTEAFQDVLAKIDLETLKEQTTNATKEILWTIAYYLVGIYLIMTYSHLIIKGLAGMVFNRITQITQTTEKPSSPSLELKADQFKIEDLHVTVNRVPYTASKCFLKFNLHYMIHHFSRDDGNVVILISTFIKDSLMQSHTVTIPAAKFSISAVYKACSFREPIELSAEKVKIKVNILFQSKSRQTLSICKGGFDIKLKPLDSKQTQETYKDSVMRVFIRMCHTLLESSALFGSQSEKALLVSEMSKEEFVKK